MNCPHCHSAQTTLLQCTTELGHAVFCCRDCGRTFNERTGTPFNFLHVPTDIVFQYCTKCVTAWATGTWPNSSCCAALSSPTRRC